jgi:hypothetical protein
MAKATRSGRAGPTSKRHKAGSRHTSSGKATSRKATSPKAPRATAPQKPLSPATLGQLRRQLLAVAPTDPEALTAHQLATLRSMLLDRIPQDPPD